MDVSLKPTVVADAATLKTCNEVLSFFAQQPAIKTQLLAGGMANKSYVVTTRNREELVIKFLITEKKEQILNDLAIQRQLTKAGVGVITYLSSPTGSYVYEKEEVLAVISPKIKGILAPRITNQLCLEIGRTLAAFHLSVKTLPQEHRGWLNLDVAQKTADELGLRATSSQAPILEAVRLLLKDGAAIFKKALPHGIIHGDLYEQNVLIKSQKNLAISAVLDFEEAEPSIFLIDLARALISVGSDPTGTKLQPLQMNMVIKGYESLRPLTKKEAANVPLALKYVAGAGAAWLLVHGFNELAQQYVKRVT